MKISGIPILCSGITLFAVTVASLATWNRTDVQDAAQVPRNVQQGPSTVATYIKRQPVSEPTRLQRAAKDEFIETLAGATNGGPAIETMQKVIGPYLYQQREQVWRTIDGVGVVEAEKLVKEEIVYPLSLRMGKRWSDKKIDNLSSGIVAGLILWNHEFVHRRGTMEP